MLHIDRLMPSIDKLGKCSLQQSINRKNDLNIASAWLKGNTFTDDIIELLDVLTKSQEQWYGAVPCTRHPLDTVFSQQRSRPQNVAVIGVDGSQIFPDRHSAVIFYLIQKLIL